jgi:gliding motility-associated-like protein
LFDLIHIEKSVFLLSTFDLLPIIFVKQSTISPIKLLENIFFQHNIHLYSVYIVENTLKQQKIVVENTSTMRIGTTVFFLSFFFSLSLWAQPVNDDCENAILIEMLNGCSPVEAYTSAGATPSGYSGASCFANGENDVWFTFTPRATDVTITIIGATRGGAPGGTLRQPEVALYLGNCGGTITEEECARDQNGSNIVELYKGGLAVGVPYLIRVQAPNGETGSFQICINNFNPPVEPGSDCATASVLCNKESFIVQSVTGAGDDPTESNGASCFGISSGANVESNSTWFVWTAANDGNLTFTLTPNNAVDDLDFIVYELPNGPTDCSDKVILRCMASGDFNFPSRCMGPTGLNNANTDISEPAGCGNITQNNFLAPLDMLEGRTYALMINNFTSTGNGFEISFGGTGEFLGPQADFRTDIPETCTGQAIVFEDASTYALGSIIDWEWSFGPSASPATASGRGNHTVNYGSPGLKSIVLTVTSGEGCQVTTIKTIRVTCCPDQFEVTPDVSDVLCPSGSTGIINLDVNNNFAPLNYEWSDGSDTEDINGLMVGNYEVTITDGATCDTVLNFLVEGPDAFEFDTLITMPTCDGGTDGVLELLTTGGTAPYTFNFENQGFGPENRFENLRSDIYQLVMRDANNCEVDLDIPVLELQLVLDPSVNPVSPPSCTGFSDGQIEVIIDNGLPAYQYNWGDGRGFVNENSLRQVSAGVFTVEVRDANLCEGFFEFDMNDPPPLALDFDQRNASCNGFSDGVITALASGGVGNYSYQWASGQRDSIIRNLSVGSYFITVLDGNDCEIQDQVEITEPPLLDVAVTNTEDIICFGDSTGLMTLMGIGGTPPYEYSPNGIFFQSQPTLTGLPANRYLAFVLDAGGCLDSIEVELTQPPALIVELGEDRTIKLGESTVLRAITTDQGVSFGWMSNPTDSLSCQNCPDPRIMPVVDTRYFVTITNGDNCSAQDSVTILVDDARPIYIPNVFSPNNDGKNDYFTVYGGPAAEQILNMKVFDRWGNLVFDRENIAFGQEGAGWDGRFNGQKMPPGTYVYLIDVQFINGTTIQYKGDITLIR